ncbi:cation diffusion facilitator family transporter [Protaetiibacter mangrovi]|uniref:Cation diffusion facilitator family transporter n=1 Tax=Protaetiibacter mangrovi TaxID=2970926 RepID=A0ABT1ZCZ1_9MICO|nr:cation diffusion facilitator family transporter [Protaetiibacter mangrovi]MCS0498559.1 cation diffusion facilitator family transporter [Protaetiibacter mangrovi]
MAVVIAFLANIAVAIAKTVAAVLTGSASLVAEALHSWADAGNEVFLLLAERSGRRRRDRAHPLGYGRDVYFWSLFAAFGLFTIGAVLSIATGIRELVAPERATDYLVAYIVLAVAAVLEGVSLAQSLRQVRRETAELDRDPVDYVLNGSNATLRAVVFEDVAALIGLAIAASALALHEITGLALFDGIGSILIGVLLAVVAVVLIQRNRRFLVGEAPPDAVRREVARRLLLHPAISRLTFLHLEFVGPGQLLLIAAVDLVDDDAESIVAVRLRQLSRELERDGRIAIAALTLALPDEPSLEHD